MNIIVVTVTYIQWSSLILNLGLQSFFFFFQQNIIEEKTQCLFTGFWFCLHLHVLCKLKSYAHIFFKHKSRFCIRAVCSILNAMNDIAMYMSQFNQRLRRLWFLSNNVQVFFSQHECQDRFKIKCLSITLYIALGNMFIMQI